MGSSKSKEEDGSKVPRHPGKKYSSEFESSPLMQRLASYWSGISHQNYG